MNEIQLALMFLLRVKWDSHECEKFIGDPLSVEIARQRIIQNEFDQNEVCWPLAWRFWPGFSDNPFVRMVEKLESRFG